MRYADVPALATRLLVLGTFLIAGAGVEASPAISHKTSATAAEPSAPAASARTPAVEVAPVFEVPALRGPTDLGFEPGIAHDLQESMPNPPPGLPGHLRASKREQEGGPPEKPMAPRRSVPEPASILLLVTGLIGLAARRHLLRNRTDHPGTMRDHRP